MNEHGNKNAVDAYYKQQPITFSIKRKYEDLAPQSLKWPGTISLKKSKQSSYTQSGGLYKHINKTSFLTKAYIATNHQQRSHFDYILHP